LSESGGLLPRGISRHPLVPALVLSPYEGAMSADSTP